jgi:hypothetical protein
MCADERLCSIGRLHLLLCSNLPLISDFLRIGALDALVPRSTALAGYKDASAIALVFAGGDAARGALAADGLRAIAASFGGSAIETGCACYYARGVILVVSDISAERCVSRPASERGIAAG